MLDDVINVRLSVVETLEHFQGFADRYVVLQRGILELYAGFFAEPFARRCAVIPDLATRGWRNPLHDLDGGGLAGPIRPEQAEANTFGDGEGDIVHRQHTRILLDEAPGLEGNLHNLWEGSGKTVRLPVGGLVAKPEPTDRAHCNQIDVGGIKPDRKRKYGIPEDPFMMNRLKTAPLGAGILALLLVAPACANVNKSITVGDNTETGSESTVNGSISVGSDSTVNGSLDTVNGTIRVGENSRIGDAETVNGSIRLASGVTADDIGSVNGSIRLGDNVSVEGEIEVVNGKITLGQGTQVADDVSNVNGEMSFTGATIGGNVSTVSGDITLNGGSVVMGDLIVEKPGGWGWGNSRKPRIVVGPGSRVEGEISLEREVELFISESADVGGVSGEMSMDDAVRFSGDRP